jgi:hypothetical protein
MAAIVQSEATVGVSEIVVRSTLKLVRLAVQQRIDEHVAEVKRLRWLADHAFSRLSVAGYAGRAARLKAQIDQLVELRDKILPSLEKVAPQLLAQVVAESFATLDDDEYDE